MQIDNEMVYHPENNVWHHPSFKLEYSNNGSTPYQFKWVYHQPFGSRQRNRIILSDIRVIGDSRGTSLATDQCERGTYSAGIVFFLFFIFLFFEGILNFNFLNKFV